MPSTATAKAPAEVSLPTHRRPGHTIVALHGALDIAAAPALREHMIDALQHSARLLILDLAEVAFSDPIGLAVLIGTQRHATWLGITLRLAGPGPQVTKMLRITGLDRSLTIHPTLPDALTAPLPIPAATRRSAA